MSATGHRTRYGYVFPGCLLVSDAAEVSGVSPDTIERALHKGELHDVLAASRGGVQDGRWAQVTRSELEAWVAARDKRARDWHEPPAGCVSVGELAASGVAPASTIYRALARGRVAAVRRGGRVWAVEDSALAWARTRPASVTEGRSVGVDPDAEIARTDAAGLVIAPDNHFSRTSSTGSGRGVRRQLYAQGGGLTPQVPGGVS